MKYKTGLPTADALQLHRIPPGLMPSAIILFVTSALLGCNTSSAPPAQTAAEPAKDIELKLGETFIGESIAFLVKEGVRFSTTEQLDGFSFHVHNVSKTKIIRFQPFDSESAALQDEHENTYRFRRSNLSARNEVTLRPGESTFFQFGFDAPVEAATKLEMILDASNLGFKGFIRVRFDRAEYDTLVKAYRTKLNR